MTTKNIAVLVSGGGTNLQAIIDAFDRRRIINGKIALDEFIEKYQITHQDIDFDPYKLFFSLFQGYLGK